MQNGAVWIAIVALALAAYLYSRVRKLENHISGGLDLLHKLGERGNAAALQRLNDFAALDSPAVQDAVGKFIQAQILLVLQNPTSLIMSRIQRSVDGVLSRTLPAVESTLGPVVEEAVKRCAGDLALSTCNNSATAKRLRDGVDRQILLLLNDTNSSAEAVAVRAAYSNAVHTTLLSVIEKLEGFEDDDFDGKLRELLLQQPFELTAAELESVHDKIVAAILTTAQNLLENADDDDDDDGDSEIDEKLTERAKKVITDELANISSEALVEIREKLGESIGEQIAAMLEDRDNYSDLAEEVDGVCTEIVRKEIQNLSAGELAAIRQKLGEILADRIGNLLDDSRSDLSEKFDEQVGTLVQELFSQDDERTKLRRIVRVALAKFVESNFDSLVEEGDVNDTIRKQVAELIRGK